MKQLFVSTRGRPDIHPTISLLTSRCANADFDDWKELKHLLTYIKGTMNIMLQINSNRFNMVKWWVDAAYAVRSDYDM